MLDVFRNERIQPSPIPFFLCLHDLDHYDKHQNLVWGFFFVCSDLSVSRRSGGRIFFSRVNFVCWLSFGVRSTPMLLQWHVKDPGNSARSAGGRLHTNTHTPLTQRSRSGLTMPLSRNSMGTYQETSAHATRQGTLGHSRLSWLSHCGLILA